jgi:Glycosyl hydrolase family 12
MGVMDVRNFFRNAALYVCAGVITGSVSAALIASSSVSIPAAMTAPASAPPDTPSAPASTAAAADSSAPADSASVPGNTLAPSTAAGSWSWCGSSGGFHQYTGLDLYNNEWNTAGNPAPDKICGNSPSDWEVISNQRADNTAVLTYPSVQQNYSPNVTISSMSKLTSTYAENMHATSGTDAEAAYDLWTTNNANEIMFWVDNHGQAPAGSQVATVSFGGLTWHLYVGGSTDSFVLDHNAASGTVDLLAGLQYLQNHGGYLPKSAQLSQASFGWEICSTGGLPEAFKMEAYTLES